MYTVLNPPPPPPPVRGGIYVLNRNYFNGHTYSDLLFKEVSPNGVSRLMSTACYYHKPSTFYELLLWYKNDQLGKGNIIFSLFFNQIPRE